MIDKNLLMRLEGQHPARTMPFDFLRAGLQARVDQGVIYCNTYDDLEVYSYSRDCMYEQAWDIFTCMARCLILDHVEKKVVATPFPKFFNWGETDYYPDDEELTAFEKMDGCLGTVFNHKGVWRFASKSSLAGPVAERGQLLLDRVDKKGLNEGTTYMFELLTPIMRIVVPYTTEELVMLAGYNEQGFEIPWSYVEDAAAESGLNVPKIKRFKSMADCVAYTEPLGYQEEGYVVRFSSGHRVKVKSDGYLVKHKVMFNFGPLRVWDSLIQDIDPEEYRRLLIEELWDEFDRLYDGFEKAYFAKRLKLSRLHEETKLWSDKELGLKMKELDRDVCQFLFAVRKRDGLTEIATPGSKLRRKFCDSFRPNGNIMEDVT